MSTQKRYKDFLKGLKMEPPENTEFSVGDKVKYTTEYGVTFSGLKIIGFSEDVFYGRFIYLDKSSWWFWRFGWNNT